MEQFFTILLQLSFVALVYYAAYRHGFKVSQKKMAEVLHGFSEPVTELIDQINKQIDQSVAAEEMNKK